MKDDFEGELHELVEVSPRNLRKYYVMLTWFTVDINRELFENFPMEIDDDIELVSTKYEVEAMTINDAISQAKLIDSARRAEILTGFHEVIHLANENGKCDYDYETVKSFREYIIENSALTDFFLSDPTSISAYLVENEKIVLNKTINNVIRKSEDIGDNMEDWLKNRDDKENEDS